jgi:hypothetical protein
MKLLVELYNPFLHIRRNLILMHRSPYDVNYCDEHCELTFQTFRRHLSCDRPVTFGISFGQMEISAIAKNEINGQT